ncbi:MAG: trehalase-like domain-containing protein, partial [Solirubrobacterales bacterium]
MSDGGFPPIGDYAFISDCHSCALIGRDASVEWACFHRFDGRPPFARILDRDVGGYFRIAPGADWEGSQRYLPDTNVLETTFTTATGAVTITDCLPLRGDPDDPGETERPYPSHLLIRVVRGIRGSVEMKLEFRPRFEYGMTTPLIHSHDADLVQATGGAEALVLQSELAPLIRDGRGAVEAETEVQAGDELVVALTQFTSHRLAVERLEHADLTSRIDETVRFWQAWSGITEYEGDYSHAVRRSALAIKGLTEARTGAVVA